MDVKIRLWLLMALMSISAYSSSELCNCLPNHAQQAFCNSGLVIRATFLGANFTAMVDAKSGKYTLVKYGIKTLEVLKGSSKLKQLKYVYTSTLRLCGYFIRRRNYNKEYLITGAMKNGRVNLYSCSYIAPWCRLSETQQNGVKGAYKCGCKICSSSECKGDKSKYCKLYPLKVDEDPARNHHGNKNQMCAPDENDECTWQPVENLFSTPSTSTEESTE
ncbi:metalloproteinase inhibitor 1-like isoform X2 [Lissotriton helveticus]